MSTPDSIPSLGELHVQRYLLNQHHVTVSITDPDLMFRAYLDHARRWDREPDPFEAVIVRQALTAAGLHLASLHKNQSVAWTINLNDPALNVFVAGDVIDGHIVARLFTENIETAETSRVYCQTQQPNSPVRQTVIDVEGLDVLVMFEQLGQRSDQQLVRYFDHDDGRSSMVLGLPGADPEWIHGLEHDDVPGLVRDPDAHLLETRLFTFACGCTEERMRSVVGAAYSGRLDELFQGEPGLQVQCPRCGHEWLLRREDLAE
ncbi:MAG: hypothetical protein KDC38_17495 [Planctomycetes bacterium]|nr:hypothetical protein [Planctomycetota bacterium]